MIIIGVNVRKSAMNEGSKAKVPLYFPMYPGGFSSNQRV